MQKTWVHFKAEDGSIFSIKTLDANKFPVEKIEKLMYTSEPKEDDLNATFPTELFEAIDRADAFAMEISDHSVIRLVLSSDKIEVSAERSSGKYAEKVLSGTPPPPVCADKVYVTPLSCIESIILIIKNAF